MVSSVAMIRQRLSEQAKFWRAQEYDNLELLRATYITHSFDRHIHEGYAIGMMERGAERFYYRGDHYVLPEGCAVVINPGEIHTGHAIRADGWTYRMFYPDVPFVQRILAEMTGRHGVMPVFNQPIIRDRYVVALIRRMHRILETSDSRLERDAAIRVALGQLILRHADDRRVPPIVTREKFAVQHARAYLRQHYAENVSLEDLAAQVNLSPYHLVHVFHAEVGVPPHVYLTHVRVERAKALLAAGQQIAQIAADVGFTDQSHLTRRFKGVVGVTPGHYRQALA